MRAEDENQCLLESSKELKISYPREFLLSLAELDTSRELPQGFDYSILRELGDCSTNLSRPCHDSETGTVQGNPHFASWRNHEQGLLGSAAFPIISRCSNGTSAPILQGCSFDLLNRSTEPYRPPHLFNARPPGRESNDQYNDETFGSSEHLSQERVEEERRRRDSFEFMRKEQERAIQEKKKTISDEYKENINPDTTIFLEEAGGDERLINKDGNKDGNSEEFELSLAPNIDSESCNTTWIIASTHLSRGSTSESLENNLNSSSTTLEFADLKEAHAKNPVSHSSDLAHSFLEEGIIIEESIFSERDGHYSTKKHPLGDWSSHLSEDSQKSSFETDAALQCLLSFPWKRVGLSDVAGSLSLKLNKSSDEFYVSETGNDENHLDIGRKGHTRSFEKNPFSPIFGTAKNSESTESSCIQGAGRNVITMNDVSKPCGFPLPAEDNYIISAGNESSIEIDFEGILFPGFVKQADLSKTEWVGQSVSDNQAGKELDLWNEPASQHSSINNSAEFDDICLPDEDSLITVDDTIFPWEPKCEAGDTSGSAVDIVEEQAVSGVTLGDNRTQDLGSLKTPFQNFSIQKSYPHIYHPWLNPRNAYFRPSNSQQAHQSFKNKIHNLTPHHLQYYPTTLHFDPFRYAYSTSPRLHSVNHPQLSGMPPIPGEFPPHQYGLPEGLSTPNKIACYAHEENSMPYYPPSYHQQHCIGPSDANYRSRWHPWAV